MIKSQVMLLLKEIFMFQSFDLHSAIPVITALLTVFTIALVPKIFPKIPGALAGLIFGIFLFQTLVYFTGNPEQSWVVGTIPSLASLQLGITPQALKALLPDLATGNVPPPPATHRLNTPANLPTGTRPMTQYQTPPKSSATLIMSVIGGIAIIAALGLVIFNQLSEDSEEESREPNTGTRSTTTSTPPLEPSNNQESNASLTSDHQQRNETTPKTSKIQSSSIESPEEKASSKKAST